MGGRGMVVCSAFVSDSPPTWQPRARHLLEAMLKNFCQLPPTLYTRELKWSVWFGGRGWWRWWQGVEGGGELPLKMSCRQPPFKFLVSWTVSNQQSWGFSSCWFKTRAVPVALWRRRSTSHQHLHTNLQDATAQLDATIVSKFGLGRKNRRRWN